MFLGGHKSAKILYIAIYSLIYHGAALYSPWWRRRVVRWLWRWWRDGDGGAPGSAQTRASLRLMHSPFWKNTASFKGSTWGPINRILHFHDPPKTIKHQQIYLISTPSGHAKASGDMVGRYMPNSGHGGYHGTRVMTIFMLYVGPHFPNIQMYVEVYEGI